MTAADATYLGFDFGTQRIGVAVGQALTRSARPLVTLRARSGQPEWAALDALIAEWRPNALIVGLPLNMDTSEHAVSEAARRFGNRLRGRYNLPVHLIDERLSSVEAEARLHEANMSRHRRQDKGLVDRVAAQLILESWLAQL